MSQKNDFKAFSISDNANIVSQEKYEESQNLKTGFPPENVSTHVLNKVLRQSSTISSVVANFIATQSGEDVLDDGDIAKLTVRFNRALDKALEQKISGISSIPVGSPIPWPLSHPPSGYFTCNGSAFSRSQYPKLAEAYPDGRIPDLRGEFIRGWDDGRGVDSGRVILSAQTDNTKRIQLTKGLPDGQFLSSYQGPVDRYQFPLGRDVLESATVTSIANNTGGHETRPRNIAFNYIVKAE
ncbi:phage tail protein [Photorhabdus laumondii subsp. laumondii]|uniref:Photorhabdus luminescens subsp. laumondii TTO1 complete genome segment 7/17 n=2 Tax=Photorhabdus laumondii subsp. laumondii TaxID=141679 RepID=Q7N5C0_PHOLL|nr:MULTISPECIES: phage tail protein [Photorhabdus]AXG47150.1 phage tail protein [Photorhabdus laumondii subsp. laumondii]MCC8384225.1 tail fiber protein [Photorhabdus laumondii]MCC8413790.1 tail fiber protein [Photorhabdus laumondii]NDK94334.1 phage tail protein [Photorhabdus laumondii subsp. laumondii]NDL20580.1 phage tail protein [Photorhabdus laumondii subsp. laumondii]